MKPYSQTGSTTKYLADCKLSCMASNIQLAVGFNMCMWGFNEGNSKDSICTADIFYLLF